MPLFPGIEGIFDSRIRLLTITKSSFLVPKRAVYGKGSKFSESSISLFFGRRYGDVDISDLLRAYVDIVRQFLISQGKSRSVS